MIKALKSIAKSLLGYRPLPDTAVVRAAIDEAARSGMPYCLPDEGDLIFTLVRESGCPRCLETGFHTASTALYMAAAVAPADGDVVSICVDDDETVARGLALLKAAGHDGRHRLIRENSNRALSDLFRDGEQFGFVFVDGWKTFDHLAMEIYLFNQMLETGGAIVFDDSYLPSVRKAIRLLKTHYGYSEVDYADYGQGFARRLYYWLTRRSPFRPYRAVRKLHNTADQPPMRDWHFYRRF